MPDQEPRVQSLVLADWVYEDKITGKKVIAGAFNTLCATKFSPGLRFLRSTWAYVCLTGLLGKHKAWLRYKDLNDDHELMRSSELEIESQDLLASLDMFFEVPPLPMPHPGVYLFEVIVDKIPAGSLRIHVVKAKVE